MLGIGIWPVQHQMIQALQLQLLKALYLTAEVKDNRMYTMGIGTTTNYAAV